MGHFLERGDPLYWEKEARRLLKLLNSVQQVVNTYLPGTHRSVELKKEIKHFRKVFSEE